MSSSGHILYKDAHFWSYLEIWRGTPVPKWVTFPLHFNPLLPGGCVEHVGCNKTKLSSTGLKYVLNCLLLRLQYVSTYTCTWSWTCTNLSDPEPFRFDRQITLIVFAYNCFIPHQHNGTISIEMMYAWLSDFVPNPGCTLCTISIKGIERAVWYALIHVYLFNWP